MKRKNRLCALALLICTVFSLTGYAEGGGERDENAVYTLITEEGKTLTQVCGVPDAGDEYISGDNMHYRITRVDENAQTALTECIGAYQMPDVSWLDEETVSVAALRRAIALYCTHSDESYEPTDGTHSDEKRGGIYDVADAFRSAMEEKGVTVYQSDETHHPHDAGAYRRSRQTAMQLLEEGVDCIIDIHRDGIPDPESYETEVKGEDTTKVRLLVGRSNQNSAANKDFATRLKAVADKVYPGLIKDIFIGKGNYNQDLMSRAILFEFGTYTNEKEDVLTSTRYMADVLYRTLYGGVTGAAGVGSDVEYKNSTGAEESENKSGFKGIAWVVLIAVAAVFIFAFAQTGRGGDAVHKVKRTFQEMSGGLFGGRKKK